MTVTRGRTDDDRRHIELSPTPSGMPEPVEPLWAHHSGTGRDFREVDSFGGLFALDDTLKSIHPSATLSVDALRHVAQPLIDVAPHTVTGFHRHGPGDAESVATSLVRLWVTSGLGEGEADLLAAYERAVTAVTAQAWGPAWNDNTSASPVNRMVLRALAADADRLPLTYVVEFVDRLVERLPAFGPEDLLAVVECLATPTGRSTMGDGLVDIMSDLLTDMLSVGSQADFSAGFRQRMRDALDRYHPGGYVDITAQLD